MNAQLKATRAALNGTNGTNGHAGGDVQRVAPPEAGDELRFLPLSRLEPCPLNPRKHFDADALADLAVSIAAKGVLEPIIARAHPQLGAGYKGPEYQIVCGERRWRAAQSAGLSVIPVIVRALSDKDVLEIQVIENEQRSDITILEKAAAYVSLVELHGTPVPELARRIGKSEAHVRSLLRLQHLPAKGKRAIEKEELPFRTVALIARLPKAQMDKMLDFALDANFDYAGVRPTFEEVRDEIQATCLIELKGAPFDQKDKDLAGQPACAICPLRVGNLQKSEPGAYGGIRADMCTKPECYQDKIQAWQARLAAKAGAAKQTVLAPDVVQDLGLFPGGATLKHDSGFVDLAEVCWDDPSPKNRTFGELLQKHLPDQEITLAFDGRGQAHRLVDKDKAAELLKEHHNIKPRRATSDSSYQRDNAGMRQRDLIRKETARRAIAAIEQEATRIGRGLDKHSGRHVTKMLRVLLGQLVGHSWEDACRLVRQRRELERDPKRKDAGGNSELIQAIVPALEPAQLIGLLAELCAARIATNWNHYTTIRPEDGDDKPLWDFFGVDPVAIEKDVAREFAAKKKEKKQCKAS